jgi:hypothetical protein
MFKLIFIYIYTYAVNHKGTSINSSRAGTQDIRGFYPHVTAPVHRAMTAVSVAMHTMAQQQRVLRVEKQKAEEQSVLHSNKRRRIEHAIVDLTGISTASTTSTSSEVEFVRELIDLTTASEVRKGNFVVMENYYIIIIIIIIIGFSGMHSRNCSCRQKS